MRAEQYKFLVKTSTPPTVEVDSRAASVYVRFKKTNVAKTVAQQCETMHLAVDLDAKGEVVGIEAVGVTQFSIQKLMDKASVQAPQMDFSRARYVPTDLVEA